MGDVEWWGPWDVDPTEACLLDTRAWTGCCTAAYSAYTWLWLASMRRLAGRELGCWVTPPAWKDLRMLAWFLILLLSSTR